MLQYANETERQKRTKRRDEIPCAFLSGAYVRENSIVSTLKVIYKTDH